MQHNTSTNSDAYWDKRFSDDWEICEGPRQSRFFARLAIEHLPSWLIEQIRCQSLTLADWGCAQGDGTDVWASYVDSQQLVGVDFSSVAIEQATKRYPAIRFVSENWLESGIGDPERYDVVFSSNTLEHFHKPYEVLEAVCQRAQKAVALALPYRELDRIDEHFFSFLPENVPITLKNGFRLVWSRVVDCRHIPGTLWDGEQLFLVYAEPTWADSLRLTLSNCQIGQVDTASEIASLHQAVADRDGQIASLHQAVADRDGQIASLHQTVNQLKIECDSLLKRLDQVLHSNSWRLTSPLRVALRVIKHGHAAMGHKKDLLQIARFVGWHVPFPSWMKTRVRKELLEKRFPDAGRAILPSERFRDASGVQHFSAYALLSTHQIRPEYCALVPNLVSIILPVYNQADLLDQSINSVLVQTYDNFELIIINDGSSDGVEKVLERYLDHPKVRCFTQANQKLPKALTNGFSFAKGEYWTWTSADNIMEPRMLELLVAKLKAEPELGMVYADYYAIDDRGSLLKDKTWRAHNRPNPDTGEIRLPRSTGNLNIVQDNFIGPCFMYRGWIGRCLKDYDPQLGVEDYDYWMRINTFFKIEHLGSDELLYRYRVHDNTLSAQAHEHRILSKVQCLMKYEQERAIFYRIPPVFVADAPGMNWLVACGVVSNSVRLLINQAPFELAKYASKSDLLVLTSETAAKNLNELIALALPTAVIFSPDDVLYQKLQRLLNGPNCLALVLSKKAADRVRLVSSCPVIDIASSQSFLAMLAFAKNYLFFHTTRTSHDLERDLPHRLVKPAGRHILVQVDSFTQGGMENVVIDLALSLQESGFRVTLLNLGKAGDAAEKARERGLRVVSFPDCSIENYAQWLVDNQITVVNAHYSIFGAVACRQVSIPFVETIHNSYVWLEPEAITKYREADTYVTAYICVSNTAAQYADVVLRLDVSKMHVVPNGINSENIDVTNFYDNRKKLREKWNVNQQSRVFLNVSSIIAVKAQVPLVKAFARVVERLPDARLVLLGGVVEMPYKRTIEQTIDDLKLKKNVIFAGYQRDVASYYHAADVFVLPSYWEGWSLALGEAIANGLPCVITDVGSAYEFEGFSNVAIVDPPFKDITELNSLNLGKYVYGNDHAFEARLSDAMIKMAHHERCSVDLKLARRLDRVYAYRSYASIFVDHLSNSFAHEFNGVFK